MINWNETNERIDGLYLSNKGLIEPLHNFLAGKRNFVLAFLEQIVGNLKACKVNDCLVEFLISEMMNFCNDTEYYYEVVKEVNEIHGMGDLDYILKKVRSDFNEKDLSDAEIKLLHEIMKSLSMDYLLSTEFETIDYNAMRVLAELVHNLISFGRQEMYYSKIELIVKGDDELVNWKADFSELEDTKIIIDWTAIDRIDHYAKVYETKCIGLKPYSICELSTADSAEERYFAEDDNYTRKGSLSMIAQRYCAVIEQEFNSIIQLKNLTNKPGKHLMWNALKKYIKDNGIVLETSFYSINDLMDDLYETRNKSAHGEKISEEEYSVLMSYKDRRLFEIISWTKLELSK